MSDSGSWHPTVLVSVVGVTGATVPLDANAWRRGHSWSLGQVTVRRQLVLYAAGKTGWQEGGPVERDGRLARAPTQEQMAFLVAMRKERFGRGCPVR